MVRAISERMRSTSRRPISWISRGASRVVVCWRAKKAYIDSPSGSCHIPTWSYPAGRYSPVKNARNLRNAGTTPERIASRARAASRARSGPGIDAAKRSNGLKNGLVPGSLTICFSIWAGMRSSTTLGSTMRARIPARMSAIV